MNTPYVFKRCSKCMEWLVANTYNFHKAKKEKYGLRHICKKCRLKYQKEYYKENKEYITEYKKEYHIKNRELINNKSKKYYQENKVIISKRKKEYDELHKEEKRERNKKYREANKIKVCQAQKKWREAHKEELAEKKRIYYQSPEGQIALFNNHHKRKVKKKNQGNGITTEQWLEMMNYFQFRCAYSGNYIGGKGEHRTIDHIIPISKGGEHEIWNTVPMYDSYNFSKHDKDMLEWYKEQDFYLEERLHKIYEWQNYAFNKWNKNENI